MCSQTRGWPGPKQKRADTTVKEEETAAKLSDPKQKQADTTVKQEEREEQMSVPKPKQADTTVKQEETAQKMCVPKLNQSDTTVKLLQKRTDKKQMIVRIRQHEQNRANFIMKNDLIEDRLELEATSRKQEATSQEQKTTGQEQKKIGQLFQDKEDTCTNWEADLDARQEGLASWQEELEGVRRSSAGKSVTIALLVLVLVLVLIILFLVLLYTFTR